MPIFPYTLIYCSNGDVDVVVGQSEVPAPEISQFPQE